MKRKNKIVFIPINELLPNPMQPRCSFDDQALCALADSIKQVGILQPLCVSPRGKLPALAINSQQVIPPKYHIIAGERRWRAAKKIGLKEVPCIITDVVNSDMAYMAFAENVFREDLSFFDIAVSLNDMLFMSGLTQSELAKKLSVSQPTIANKIRLLRFDAEEREVILKNGLTERHARALLRIENKSKREWFVKRIVEKNWNAAETERQINQYLVPSICKKSCESIKNVRRMGKINDMGIFFNSIDNAIRLIGDCGVMIERTQRDCGDKIEILLSVPKQVQ